MPKEIYKILGQERPDVITELTLYTVPKNRSAIVKIGAFNHNAGAVLVSVAVVPNGGGLANPPTVPKNYLVQDLSIDPKKSDASGVLKGITMGEFDQIRIKTDTINEVSFHAYGVELEP